MTILLFCFSAREHKDFFYRSLPASQQLLLTSLPPPTSTVRSTIECRATISQEGGASIGRSSTTKTRHEFVPETRRAGTRNARFPILQSFQLPLRMDKVGCHRHLASLFRPLFQLC